MGKTRKARVKDLLHTICQNWTLSSPIRTPLTTGLWKMAKKFLRRRILKTSHTTILQEHSQETSYGQFHSAVTHYGSIVWSSQTISFSLKMEMFNPLTKKAI